MPKNFFKPSFIHPCGSHRMCVHTGLS